MAKNKRQKVKHYNRSFYSRETRVKRGIGIVVLVAAVLAAAWFAAPHVLDWVSGHSRIFDCFENIKVVLLMCANISMSTAST